MRICYISHSSSHFSAPYTEYFSRCGHEVHLVSLEHGDVPHAIMHHPLRRGVAPERAGLVYLWAHRAIRRVLRQIRPDIVHAHYVTSNGFMAARTGFHPLVVSARGSDINQALQHPVRRRLVQYALRRANLVNVVSKELEQRVLALGIPPEKVLLLTQGIDVSRFGVERTSRRPGPVRMICTRRIDPIYQCDRIALALGVLASRGIEFEFTFAAGGRLEPELRQQVREAGLGNRVRFLGGFRNADLPEMLADADVYVSASLSDGTSPSLLEAMAAGVFPVISDIPANREWLTGDGDGLFFDPASQHALAEALTSAVVESQRWVTAAVRNRDRVARDADREVNMRRLAEQYSRLLGARV